MLGRPYMNPKYVRYRLDALASCCPWLEVKDFGKYYELKDDNLVETDEFTFSLSVVSGGSRFTKESKSFSLYNDKSTVNELFLETALGVTEMAIENSFINISEGQSDENG
ncbi:hypothetical protein LCGC14_0466960 [marine sediment metagenome]|uniref:Uncharacterized protein n=1 Tax=marine sediment metagenome TaxID=412755 RepID=A0A0F9V0A2_9ZZZZ